MTFRFILIAVLFSTSIFMLIARENGEPWFPLKRNETSNPGSATATEDTLLLEVEFEQGTYQTFNRSIGSCLLASSYSDAASLPAFIDFETKAVTINGLGSVRAEFELSAAANAPVGGPFTGTITYTIYRDGSICRERTFDLVIFTTPALPPEAEFVGTPRAGVVPFTVSFTDSTRHGVSSRLWDFGDGNTSTLRDPQHTYTNPGNYTVSLNITGPAGTDFISKTDFINGYECSGNNIYWTGSGDGATWNDPANWCSGVVPGTNDHVFIIFDEFITPGGIYTITLDGDATVSNLTLGGDVGEQALEITGAVLTVANTLTVRERGKLSLLSGSIDGPGDIMVQGYMNWSSGIIDGAGDFTVDGQLVIGTGGVHDLVNRSLLINADGLLTLNDGTFSSDADITANGFFQWNSGTISGSGMLIVNDSLRISSYTSTLNGKTFVNKGHAVWDGGDIWLNGGAQFINQPGAILEIPQNSYNFHSADSGGFDNQGLFAKGAGQPTDILVPFSNSGTVTVDSLGSLFFHKSSVYGGTLTVKQGGNLAFDGTSAIHQFLPSVIINSSGTINFSDGTIINNSDLEINGMLLWRSSMLSGSGMLIVNDSLRISSYTGTLDGKTFVNKGHAVWDGGDIWLNGGAQFINQPGAVFEIQQNSYDIRTTGGGSVDNQGYFIKLEGSTADVRAPFSNSGEVMVDSLGALLFSSDITNHPGGDIRGYGTLILSSANFVNQGAISPGASPGILTITGNYGTTAGTLNIELDNSPIPGSGHDQLSVSGGSTLGGTLNLFVTDGYLPNPGDQFTILHSNSGISGSFAAVNAPLWLTYQLQYNSNDVIVTVGTGSAPALLAPLNGAVNVNLTPTLRWRSTASADSYHVQIDTSLSFSNPIVDENGLTDTLFIPATLDHFTTYYWRVRNMNLIGPSPFSAAWHFTTIITAPATPTLSTPLNGTTGLPPASTLRWHPAARAASYRVQVAADSNFTTFAIDSSGVADTAFVAENLEYNNTYFWRISAANDGGISPFSNTWAFTTTIAAPSAPLLAAPPNSATGIAVDPTLHWHPVATADSYRVQLAADSNFATLLVDSSGVADTTLSVAGLNYETIYFWQVKAVNPGGESPFSETWQFTTMTLTGLDIFGQGLPKEFILYHNFPNPFNPATRIRYGLPRASKVRIEIYNIAGQKVATLVDAPQAAGYYTIEFDGMRLASGIYFYRMQAEKYVSVKKMILLK